jgi:hypothetical protein
MMWHPTKGQWHLIWASTLVFLISWLATDPEPHAFFLPFTAIGALFAWNISADSKEP